MVVQATNKKILYIFITEYDGTHTMQLYSENCNATDSISTLKICQSHPGAVSELSASASAHYSVGQVG